MTPVAGTEWALEEGTFRGQPIPRVVGHPITARLGVDRLDGTAACNRYIVFFERLEGNVRIDDVLAGAMGCVPAEVMVSERAFLTALTTMTRIDDSSPDVLVIEGPELELRFVPRP